MPKEDNYVALLEPMLKNFHSVEISVFDQLENSLFLGLLLLFFFHFVSLAWNAKPLLMPQIFKNHEETECYPRNFYTKSIQPKNLVKQNRLFGRPHCPLILSRATIWEML